jgi:hypothetical protein
VSVLSVSNACTIADILRAAQGNQPVTRLLENGQVVVGTARAITHEGGGFLGADDDVREGFLWMTMGSGFEQWWPMSEIVPLVQSGEIALNYSATA